MTLNRKDFLILPDNKYVRKDEVAAIVPAVVKYIAGSQILIKGSMQLIETTKNPTEVFALLFRGPGAPGSNYK